MVRAGRGGAVPGYRTPRRRVPRRGVRRDTPDGEQPRPGDAAAWSGIVPLSGEASPQPKSEYSDPDQFYSAIGEQLGIPEVAWKAAAEKFGWKKDDGKNTFTMLKGGPTAGGGEGTWDMLFIRSKINPDTKRPNPATMEQVMVQIDYDGKITFPEIPKGSR